MSNKKNAFDQVHLSLLRSEGEGSCFYVDGPGGSGKTFLYNALLDLAVIIGLSAISSAYTGIAGSLLRNGSTIPNFGRIFVSFYFELPKQRSRYDSEGFIINF